MSPPPPAEAIFEVWRDQNGNLYCTEREQGTIAYQTEVLSVEEHKLLIHKGDGDSPVIATADLSKCTEGLSSIEFIEPQVNIQLEHVHHKLPLTHGNTYFDFGGRQYHWKAHTVLIENDTRVCLALYYTVIYDGLKKALGSIVLTADGSLDGMDVLDLVVVTRLVDMARSDEAKLLKIEHSSKK